MASDAYYRGERFLCEQIRSKVLIRLLNAVQLEWDGCHNLNEDVNVLQIADARFHAAL